MKYFICLLFTALFAVHSSAQQIVEPVVIRPMVPQYAVQAISSVDYEGFLKIANEAQELRDTRLIDLETFLELSTLPGAIVLDTRSEAAYRKKHIKGAVHLNFSDFTREKLEKIIPSSHTIVLIYCNNNFINDRSNFPSKLAMGALNIPTFINLFAYDYRNIYELGQLISLPSEYLEFEGTNAY